MTEKLLYNARLRTRLANQRTILAYLRTGLAIAGVSGFFKNNYTMTIGIFISLVSLYQYFYIERDIYYGDGDI